MANTYNDEGMRMLFASVMSEVDHLFAEDLNMLTESLPELKPDVTGGGTGNPLQFNQYPPNVPVGFQPHQDLALNRGPPLQLPVSRHDQQLQMQHSYPPQYHHGNVAFQQHHQGHLGSMFHHQAFQPQVAQYQTHTQVTANPYQMGMPQESHAMRQQPMSENPAYHRSQQSGPWSQMRNMPGIAEGSVQSRDLHHQSDPNGHSRQMFHQPQHQTYHSHQQQIAHQQQPHLQQHQVLHVQQQSRPQQGHLPQQPQPQPPHQQQQPPQQLQQLPRQQTPHLNQLPVRMSESEQLEQMSKESMIQDTSSRESLQEMNPSSSQESLSLYDQTGTNQPGPESQDLPSERAAIGQNESTMEANIEVIDLMGAPLQPVVTKKVAAKPKKSRKKTPKASGTAESKGEEGVQAQQPPVLAQSPAVSHIPGYDLKKRSLKDLGEYVEDMIPHLHPENRNMVKQAQQCLTGIARKIRTNVVYLERLRDIIHKKNETDPGCILIRKTKDGRMSIPQMGPNGETKAISPPLILLQLFFNPTVSKISHLSNLCSHPLTTGEGSQMCISPLHYQASQFKSMNEQQNVKSPRKGVAKKPEQIVPDKIASGQIDRLAESEAIFSPEDSESDYLSDDSDDGVDWEARWRSEAVEPTPVSSQIRTITDEEIINNINILSLKPCGEGSLTVDVKESLAVPEAGMHGPSHSTKILEKMKIIDDIKCLFKSTYDLSFLHKVSKAREPKTRTKKLLAKQREKYILEKGIQEKGKIGQQLPPMSTDMPDDQPESRMETEKKAVVKESDIKVEPTEEILPMIKQEVEEEDDEDQFELQSQFMQPETNDDTIQNLLENIKESFEADLDMELEQLSQDGHEPPEFNDSNFAISNAFSLSSFGQSMESFQDGGMLNLDSGPAVPSGTSDAMLGYGGGPDFPLLGSSGPSDLSEDPDRRFGAASEEDTMGLPCIVNAWSVTDNDSRDQDDRNLNS